MARKLVSRSTISWRPEKRSLATDLSPFTIGAGPVSTGLPFLLGLVEEQCYGRHQVSEQSTRGKNPFLGVLLEWLTTKPPCFTSC